MADAPSLEKLPLEVLHQIFSSLSAAELASVRLVSRSLLAPATANPLWRRLFLHGLLPAYVALQDVAAVPPPLWDLSLADDGWYRAYTTIRRVAREPWLRRDEDLHNTYSMVYFKAHLRQGSAVLEDYHALVKWSAEGQAIAIDGLPLPTKQWKVVNGNVIVSAYPPNVAGRHQQTWCRSLQHISVLMLSDSPEFLSSMLALNAAVVEAAVQRGALSQSEAQARKTALADAAEHITRDPVARLQQLRESQAAAAGTPVEEVEVVADSLNEARVQDRNRNTNRKARTNEGDCEEGGEKEQGTTDADDEDDDEDVEGEEGGYYDDWFSEVLVAPPLQWLCRDEHDSDYNHDHEHDHEHDHDHDHYQPEEDEHDAASALA